MFINVREAVPKQMMMVETGHPQPRTSMRTENFAAHSLVTNNVQPLRTKDMDMRYHWLRCRDAQGKFRYYWWPGTANLGKYWTKHHPCAHQKSMRSTVLKPIKEVTALWKTKMTRTKCQLQNFKDL